MRVCTLLLLAFSSAYAEKVPMDKLIEMAKSHSPDLEQALKDTLGADAIQKRTAVDGIGKEFIWAVAAPSQPKLKIDYDTEIAAVTRAGSLWMYQGPVTTGTAHKFVWIVGGKAFGGKSDIPAYGSESYPKPGIPERKLTGPIALESKIYPDMKANVWYYVPAQWDRTTPLPVQIWGHGHGQGYVRRMSKSRALEVLDNLTAEKQIPVMVNIFIQPGQAGARGMPSVEYETVGETYPRYLLEEVLPEIGKTVKLRQDAYSRAIIGQSSGGIAAFNAAYLKPDQFSRVVSWIGSFAPLQISPEHPVGGAEYPARVRREPKRSIRGWFEDGSEDQDVQFGSWPFANLYMANSLKFKGYDYHFSYGVHTHDQAAGNAALPESLPWLWRGYDPAKTTQDFVQDPEEVAKPLWRAVTLNRN